MRKFTIFCFNRETRTACFSLLLLSVIGFGCKSNNQDPTPQNAGLYGAWQETTLINYTYENNILSHTDTLPVMTNKGIMYTVFKHDGTFEAYEVNGANNIIDEFDGPFNLMQSTNGNQLTQTWPTPSTLTTADKYNVGSLKSGFSSPSTPQALNFNATINPNVILLSGTIQVIGNASAGNYTVQVRQLTRWQ